MEILKIEACRLLFYPRGALWYVGACIIGALLLVPFLKAKKLNLALCIGAILYIFLLVCNNYFFLVNNTRIELLIHFYLKYFLSARNGIFVGFLLLAIGIKCAEIFQNYNKIITTKNMSLMLIPAIFLYVTEVFLIKKFAEGFFREDKGYYISQLILVPIILFFALTLKLNVPEKVSRLFRDLSIGIYLLHVPVAFLINFAKLPYIANFFIVVAVSTSICLFVYHFKKEPFYSLLR